MNRDVYINQIKEHESDNLGRFLLDPLGIIVSCNACACRMFKFNSQDDLCGLSYKVLVPDEFAASLPDRIIPYYLTNGKFYQRVNKCGDGSLISTLIKTEYAMLDTILYVEVTVLINTESVHIGELRYKQLSEVLQCELHLLKTNEVGSEGKYINRILQNQLADYSLTCKEIEFCSLLHSGMHTKEIADLLNQTVMSMYTFRKRLRKKLNLDPKADLYLFLHKLSK